MKKYFLFLILILVVIGNLFMANAIMVSNNATKKFANSGYILKYSGETERYYFGDNATYKESYNNQVVFKNTDGDKIAVNKTNFIHYADGSVSSFSKGALINLDEIEADPITYYNFSANKVLKKLSNGVYIAKNLSNELEFTNLVWKISDSKFLIAGTNMKILFSDGTTQEVDSYLEIEYIDNEIVKIFNQEVNYETISTEVYLQVGEDIKINMGTRNISKGDVKEMSLGNMVIDSNDNINVVDLEEYEEEENNNNNNDNGSQGGNSGAISGGNITANGGTTIIGGDVTSPETPGEGEGDGGEGSGNVEEEVKNPAYVIAPKYTVTEFRVSATGVEAIVEIEDTEARLTTGTVTSILENATGKEVYSLPETGETQIKIDTSSLEPDKEYTLVMKASYTVDGKEYTRNFIYKIFRTQIFGVTLEKDLFTDNSLAFNLKFDSDSTVSKLDVELVEAGQVRTEIINNNGSTERIQFSELAPDTEYTVKIKNVFVGNTSNSNTYTYTFRTLKSTPELTNGKTHGDVQVEIDKLNSQFIISVPDLSINTVETLNYKIYTETEGVETLVYNRLTNESQMVLKVDETTIQRNTEYYCKVYATFNDNEKVVEYEIANTETSFNMNSSKMPSIRFEKGADGEITFNSIKGSIVIDDEGETISATNAKVEIIYSSTTRDVDDSGNLTFTGIDSSLELPIDLKELKSNETYKLSVYATYDLYDGNGERYGHIGSIMITTKEPVPLKAKWKNEDEGINVSLQLESTEGSDLEALSLYSIDVALYLGQEGASKTPIATAKLKDAGVETFVASLKEKYYDNMGTITQQTFGLTNTQISAIKEENRYCTIVLTNAKDYVSKNEKKNFENIIPIENFSLTYPIQSVTIENPTIIADAVDVELVPKSKIETITYDQIVKTADYENIEEIVEESKINNTTTVAIKVSANMSNDVLSRFKYFEYFVCSQNATGEEVVVEQTGLIEKDEAKNESPSALFLLSNGTYGDGQGSLERGQNYYIKYYAYVDDEKNGKYPLDVDENDYWTVNTKLWKQVQKQEANVVMYPSISSSNSLSYKYKITDIDDAICEEGGKKYFYHYYADLPMYEGNKKEITEGANEVDNGYWTVQFDLSGVTQKNYNFDVKIKQKLINGEEEKNITLITQKFEEILSDFDPQPEINENEGMSLGISFNNLSAVYKEKITKIVVELEDSDEELSSILLEKERAELINNNWTINIDYLDIIYQTEDRLKDKNFKINIKINYINGISGYDAIEHDENLTYQSIDGEWVAIFNTGEFFKVTDGQPIVYNSHKYDFTSDRVLIKQNEIEKSWLNYSSKGLTRNIGTQENVSIIPKKIVQHEDKNVDNIVLDDVIPGIKSLEDLEIINQPTGALITIGKIYDKDTVLNSTTKVYADVYTYNDNVLVKEKQELVGDTIEIKYLNQGEQYYCKLYYINGADEKCYLYDIDKQTNNVKYLFGTLEEVKVENLKVKFTKDSTQEGEFIITHGASVDKGFKGFLYEICDESGNLINKEISYKTKDGYSGTSSDGRFEVTLENYDEEKSGFEVIIDASRNEFFEYNTTYKIKVTPVVETEAGNTENIGNTKVTSYYYLSTRPVMLLYAKRMQAVDVMNSYIEWNISLSDDKFLVLGEEIEYEVYKNGGTTPIKGKTKITLTNNYATIRFNKSDDAAFNIESAYTLKVYYKYYTSNQGTDTQEVTKTKELLRVVNGISLGAVNWSIEDNEKIKLKFYDSYQLSSVTALKCSIYDSSGKILKNTSNITGINIIDQTANLNDSHKSITFDPDYTFEESKSYIIAVRFFDDDGNELASFEAESPETITN